MKAQVAVIRELECIGCGRCLPVCPVDAIIGAHKQLHTVIADVCTGCELCLQPCPVDCIDLTPSAPKDPQSSELRKQQREWRLARQPQQQSADNQLHQEFQRQSLEQRWDAVQAAALRAKTKKIATPVPSPS